MDVTLIAAIVIPRRKGRRESDGTSAATSRPPPDRRRAYGISEGLRRAGDAGPSRNRAGKNVYDSGHSLWHTTCPCGNAVAA